MFFLIKNYKYFYFAMVLPSKIFIFSDFINGAYITIQGDGVIIRKLSNDNKASKVWNTKRREKIEKNESGYS